MAFWFCVVCRPVGARGFENENKAFKGCECCERCAQKLEVPGARVPLGEERARMPVRLESRRLRYQGVGATVPGPALRQNVWTNHSGAHPSNRGSNQTGRDC